MKKKPSGSRSGRVILTILIVIFACIFAFACYKLGSILLDYAHNAQVQDELQDLFFTKKSGNESSGQKDKTDPADPAEPEKESVTGLPEFDFGRLLEINSDLVGWLYIPAADVNHPVVQAGDNDYYMHRNFYGDFEAAGTMFLDYRCRFAQSDISIIYGHSMNDGSMLHPIRRLLDQAVADENPYFWFITPDCTYRCDIISTYLTTTAEHYNQPDFLNGEEKMNFLREMEYKSEVLFPAVDYSEEDHFLMLSTCNYTRVQEEGRQVLLALMTEVE